MYDICFSGGTVQIQSFIPLQNLIDSNTVLYFGTQKT